MDLLRIVLSRLPLKRLLQNGLIDRSLIRIRMKDVNRSEESVPDPSTYVELSSLQGELCDPHDCKLVTMWILSRAAFLNDFDSYGNFFFGGLDFNIALRSSDPRIRSMAASRYRPETDLPIVDPESIPWTADLRRELLSRLRIDENSSADSRYLFGYLHYPEKPYPTGGILVLRGYIRAVMAGTDGSFEPNPLIDDLVNFLRVSKHVDPYSMGELLISCGYFTHLRDVYVVRGALTHVYPRILKLYLPQIPVAKIDVTITITESLVRRAHEMLRLSDQLDSRYLIFLRILTGGSVDLSGIDDHQKENFVTLMLRVAHPQLTPELVDLVGEDVFDYESNIVLYDLVNYFHIRNAEYPIFNEDDDRYKLHRLFAAGGILKIRDTEIFEQEWIL